MKLSRAAVVYDITNKAHTESAFLPFKDQFESLGGNVVFSKTFISGPDVSFTEIANQIIDKKPDCLFILANAMDSAMLCQQLRKLDYKIQIVASDWSATDEIIQFGGKSVEGLFFYHSVNKESKETKYLDFKEAFIKRFGNKPGFAAIHGYDAAMVIITALEKNPDASVLHDTILEIETFQGLQSEIIFDEFGDVIRKHFPFRIKDGQFVEEIE